jgi:dethiobiotin synthetase
MWPESFYLSGTDTDVGKTLCAALLCAAFEMDYWKPVQAGLSQETDTQTVARLSQAQVHPERWRLQRASSPHSAADAEGLRLKISDFELPTKRPLLVEGAGGYQVPYADKPLFWQGDLIRHLDLPVVLVARSGLGTLNHTLLSLRALKADGQRVAGIVLVGDLHSENERDLTAMGAVPVLARIPFMQLIDEEFPLNVRRLRLARSNL